VGRGYATATAGSPTFLRCVDFTLRQEIAAPVDAVGAALVDPDFLVLMAELPKLGSADVLGCTRDGDIVAVQVRYLFQADLPGAVTRFVDPDQLSWVEDSTCDMSAHHTQCVIRPDHYENLLSGDYEARIAPTSAGSVRTVKGTIKVHVPLVGGKAEKAIVGGLQENATAQTAILSDWIARR
jgi:uncharacterized protein DUF2505